MSQYIKTNIYKGYEILKNRYIKNDNKTYDNPDNDIERYIMCRKSMDTIYNTINESRDKLTRPFGMRLTLFLNPNQQLDHRSFKRCIQLALKDYSYYLIYRYEVSKERILSYRAITYL